MYTYLQTLAQHDDLPISSWRDHPHRAATPGGAHRLWMDHSYPSAHQLACQLWGQPCGDSTAGDAVPCQSRVSAHPVRRPRSEEHTSELQSLMRISYAVF